MDDHDVVRRISSLEDEEHRLERAHPGQSSVRSETTVEGYQQ